MNILHARTDPSLLERFKEMLSSSARTDIAVGYFFISGFDAVASELSRLQKVRILLGRTDRHVIDEVAAGLQQAEVLRERLEADSVVRRSQQEQIAASSIRHIADGVAQMSQDRASQDAVRILRDLIAAKKVEIRSYLKGALHAKAYLCWYENHAEKGAAVVGSSNFTLAGFEGNTELNVRVTGDAEMEALRQWFEELWRDSKDVTEQVRLELDRSWAVASTPPYHVYLKVLYELYKEQLPGGEESLIPQRAIQLANFQWDAVRQAMTILVDQDFNGCYVADVVGLGKSFVGSEILRQLRIARPNDGHPLIICPRNLVPQWERYNEIFGLGAAVVSQSMIAPARGLLFDEATGKYLEVEEPERGIDLQAEFPNRGAVLVDEAHNFRNDTSRYRGLQAYLQRGSHKVVLMSATPQNLGPSDMYRQVRLFLEEVDHGLKIEPVALRDFFHAAEEWYRYGVEEENYRREFEIWLAGGSKGSPPIKPTPIDLPRADIETLLKPILIRRRRRDIRELYPDAVIGGKLVRFPEPEMSNIPYRLDQVYRKAGRIDELQHLLKAHTASRYRAVDFLTETARGNPRYKDLLRARTRIANLMRALLFKRLESSVVAFKGTLEALITSNRNYRSALEAGYVPVGPVATRLLSGETFDAEDLLDALTAEEPQQSGTGSTKYLHPVSDFKMSEWFDGLDADFRILDDLRNRVRPISPKDDDKLQELRRFLERPDSAKSKVLIFSEAETTVEYLYQELNPGGRDSSIARLSGSNRNSIEHVVKRFAPDAQLRTGEKIPGPPIRILIATDVVSEGQNLQDCFRVINYDLHWNPVRLIQRFGRVDRIGQHRRPQLHNFWPDTDLDVQLDLTERLLGRIQAFHDLIGLDSRLLSDAEKLNYRAMYRIYKEQRMPDPDEGFDGLAAHQRGIAVLLRIQREDPDLWNTITNLPDGIRSALATKEQSAVKQTEDENAFAQAVMKIEGAQLPLESPLPESFGGKVGAGDTAVLLNGGGVIQAFAVADDLVPRGITHGQLVTAIECGPETPAAQLSPRTNERVMTAFDQFREELKTRLGRSRRPGSDTRLRRYLSRELNIARQQHLDDAEYLKQIEVLRQIFLDHLPSGVLEALRDSTEAGLRGDSLLRRLEALRERFRLNPPESGGAGATAEPSVIRIVCSEGLVGN